MYWFITYSWVSSGERIYAHDVHSGSMTDWIGAALEEPEEWILINQVQLTYDQWLKYRFSV